MLEDVRRSEQMCLMTFKFWVDLVYVILILVHLREAIELGLKSGPVVVTTT